MSSGNQIPTIIKIKKQIQEGIKNNNNNNNNNIDENILNQISKYKEANTEELGKLSNAFGNVVTPQQEPPSS